jgi:ribonuclease HII
MLEHALNKTLIEAGCDEAGRGCLAGPVVAAAVVLNPNYIITGLNDSKQLNPTKLDKLRLEIEKNALAWAVAFVYQQEIDEINILNASIKAMHLAVSKLKIEPEHLIIDGNRFKPYGQIPYSCIIKGDGKYASIAAASILAKTHRDEYMHKLHEEHQVYNWKQNKGYPTKAHRKAIIENGIVAHHRKSFNLVSDLSNEQLLF